MKITQFFHNLAFKFSGIIVLFFQYVPNTTLWVGIMSMPLLFYFQHFLAQPSILIEDITFFFGFFEGYVIIIGLFLFIYSLGYQLRYRKMFIKKGPYKYVRHPQYLGIIIMTFGLTALSLNAGVILPGELFNNAWILYVWVLEVLAYITLAKIEEISMKARYGEEFKDYTKKVPFMIPNLKIKRIIEKDKI